MQFMNESILLTGASGFTSRALAEALRKRGCRVLALSARGVEQQDEYVCALADAARLRTLVYRLQPQRVLAAASSPELP